MNKLFLCCLILASCSFCFAQTGPVPFKFGTQVILIPAPTGFANEFGKDLVLTAKLKATMEANNELLAIYVTNDDIARRKRGASGPPGFYIAVISMKNVQNTDITAEDFKALAEREGRSFPLEVDPKNKEIAATVDSVVNGKTGQKPVVLGWFDKQPDSFGAMLIGGTQFVGVPIAAASAYSYILVRKRIVYVIAFRIVNDVTEVVTYADFIKKWSSQIKAANK